MNRLSFRLEPYEEGSGKLFATLSGGQFAGEGGAYFNTDDLQDFASALSAYPLRPDFLPAIASGFGESPETLTQTHLSVAFHPHNNRGEIRVTVRLATEIWKDADADLACEVVARFLVTYADLDRFVPEFLEVVNWRRDKACLQSSIE